MECSDTLVRMNNTKRKNRLPLADLQDGQLWRMADSKLQIEEIGKLLVYYRLYKGDTTKATKSLSPVRVVEKFLKENKAVLV